jgi:hypothetical protein
MRTRAYICTHEEQNIVERTDRPNATGDDAGTFVVLIVFPEPDRGAARMEMALDKLGG